MISAFAAATPSSLPKPSRCAGAIMVIADSVGAAISHSRAISPAWFAPISITADSVVSSIRSSESGQPISLFKLPRVFTVLCLPAITAALISLAVVLPHEPVSAKTSSRYRRRCAAANCCNARSGSGVTKVGPASHGLWLTTGAAPFAKACGANAWPSKF